LRVFVFMVETCMMITSGAHVFVVL
jgi:hypothetical protein